MEDTNLASDHSVVDPAVTASMPPGLADQTLQDGNAAAAAAHFVLDENTLRSLQRFMESQGLHPATVSSDTVFYIVCSANANRIIPA
jgi:hypothetical protein